MSKPHQAEGGDGRTSPPREVGGRRLFWQVFLHGLLLIALVVAALAVVTVVFREGWWREATQVSRYVGEHVAELREDPRQLKAELLRVREAFGVEASIYATDGKTLLASSADPPIPPRLAPGATEAEGFPGRHGRGGPCRSRAAARRSPSSWAITCRRPCTHRWCSWRCSWSSPWPRSRSLVPSPPRWSG